MAKIKVTNPHPRVLNLAHAGASLMLVPGQEYEVEGDATVKKLIEAGELKTAAAVPVEGQEPEPEELSKPAKAPAKKGR